MSSGSETALKIRQAEIISERDAALAEIERLRAERITFRIDNVDVTAEQYVAHRVARAFDYAADIAWRHSTGEEAADAIRAAKNGGVG